MSHEQRMADAGIELPEGYPPAGLYVGAVRVGNHLHIGGHGPVRNDGSMVTRAPHTPYFFDNDHIQHNYG